MSQVQQLYSAIIARGTRSVPTYSEVERDVRQVAIAHINAQLRS